VIRHNHKLSKKIFESYKSTLTKLSENDLFDVVDILLQAKTPTRNICDVVATRCGVHLTAKDLANTRRVRLFGRSAIHNLLLLLERFASFDGSRCTIIEDQAGQLCGIAIQSAAQRDMFAKYGDSLLLDWTHSTNNIGYYLG
jgi:hypothetical protein